ncbi:type II toxin-antitoxin system VapC family toxin [Fibrella sp. WM1]|uniref:type II toxin-antitoxin system VapC family toxin n=1 Tax=Fibrella musci TaxID=3242485 RepID=UPI0035222F0A
MGVTHLWDTNTVIYYLQQQFPLQAETFIDQLLLNESPCFSAVTEIELLCWKTASEQELTLLRQFISNSLVIELEQAIKWKAADLRRQYAIKLPDAIIAATAIVYDLTLLSRNEKDFRRIPDLHLHNPWV